MGNTKTVKQYENSDLQVCITGELRTKRTNNDLAGLFSIYFSDNEKQT